MSGDGLGGPAPGPDDDMVLVAGEYVLGTLPPDDAIRLAQEAATDPALAAAIAGWEDRLAPLTALAVPAEPPATLWPRIEASAYGDGVVTTLRPRRSERGSDPARLTFWRGAAAAGFLLAAGIAGVAILPRQPASGPRPMSVAVLSPLGAKPAAFLVEAQPDGALSVLSIRPEAVPAGRDLEFWSLPAGATVPRPLGVLRVGGLRLAARAVRAGPMQILVSLEPKGGSPTGLPTGPVLYGGTLGRAE